MAADLRYFEASAKQIAKVAKTDKIVVEKSTLPVRTAEKIKEILYKHGKVDVHFEILSNPEFLAEGTAIQDLFKSDRVLIGGDPSPSGQMALKALVEIYDQWIPREKILTTNVWSSELAKLASNAMLAQRISSINSLSALCEKTGADIDELSKAIGMDHRIGPHFLKASVGFGGSCFQKDILNLVYLCRHYGLEEVAQYWHQVIKINDYQKSRFAQKIIDAFEGNVQGKNIAILGWAFKKDTDDSRESAAIYVAVKLLESGFNLKIYDPKVQKNTILNDIKNLIDTRNPSSLVKDWVNKLQVKNSVEKAIENTVSIAVLTEWDEFKEIDLSKSSKVFDGRNVVSNSNSQYTYSIGKSVESSSSK
tara:strand:+ start:1 stop:1092 length:1092 start_codon:yes stop_codon:yes gene_type:complete